MGVTDSTHDACALADAVAIDVAATAVAVGSPVLLCMLTSLAPYAKHPSLAHIGQPLPHGQMQAFGGDNLEVMRVSSSQTKRAKPWIFNVQAKLATYAHGQRASTYQSRPSPDPAYG